MTTAQALVRNMRTCRSAVKREAQVELPRGESIDAGHRGGSVRSSVEASVMELERRDRIIQFELVCHLQGVGTY